MVESDCTIHPTAKIIIPELVNIYGCKIGAMSKVGPFVEIQRGAEIGEWVSIESHTFICDKVKIGDRVFIGHNVTFTNDIFPKIMYPYSLEATVIEDDVSIGSGAILLPVRIGKHAMVGAGSVVTKDVEALSIVVGNPAKLIKQFESVEELIEYRTKRSRLNSF